MSQDPDIARRDTPDPVALAEPGSTWRRLAEGSAAVGTSTVIERGFGFLGNLAAAAIGGPAVFGAYMLAQSTAGFIANYCGAGIGTTAIRFSGEYPADADDHAAFVRGLQWLCLGAAALACAVMFFGAQPLAATVLDNPDLTLLLQIAALTATVRIGQECLRGFLVGQRRYLQLIVFSIAAGIALLVAVPAAARFGANWMLVAQAAALVGAFAVWFAQSWRKGRRHRPARLSKTLMKSLLGFSAVQLSAVFGISLASWALALLVTRQDSTMMQMGIYGLALQLRNLIATLPGILAQVALPIMTEEKRNAAADGSSLVVQTTTSLSLLTSLALGGGMLVVLPPLLGLVGDDYRLGQVAVALSVCAGMVHVSMTPVAHRLMIEKVSALGVINFAWTVLVIALGALLVPAFGAAGATGAWLASFVFSALATYAWLWKLGGLSNGMGFALTSTISAPLIFGALAIARHGGVIEPLASSALLALCTAGMLGVVGTRSVRRQWLPEPTTVLKKARSLIRERRDQGASH